MEPGPASLGDVHQGAHNPATRLRGGPEHRGIGAGGPQGLDVERTKQSARGDAPELFDPPRVEIGESQGSHRKLSSSMRSESNRTISVASAQRPSRDTVMCVKIPGIRNPSRPTRATR